MPFIAAWTQEEIRAVRWADKNPVAWQIVTTDCSKALGLGSTEYPESIRHSDDSTAIRDRVVRLHELIQDARRWGCTSLFAWRATFAMTHFLDPGFTSGLFQQFSGRTERVGLFMDYTPETLNEVIDQFAAWRHHGWPVTRVTLDGQTVRQFVSPNKPRVKKENLDIRG
jgi:hypothetical protein